MIEKELREWHEAERKAELAEQALRQALGERLSRQDLPPPLSLQERATLLRAEADQRLKALLARVESGDVRKAQSD